MIRLDKLLAHAGYGTRLEVTKLIKSNQVTINKKIVTKGKYSLQGPTQGNGLTGGVPPVRFSM